MLQNTKDKSQRYNTASIFDAQWGPIQSQKADRARTCCEDRFVQFNPKQRLPLAQQAGYTLPL